MKHKQKKVIFFITGIGNLDDTVEVEDDIQTFDTEKEALDNAKDITQEYGMRMYVYKCVPILQVDIGRIRVTKV